MAFIKHYKNSTATTSSTVLYFDGKDWIRKQAYVYWNNKWNILTEKFLSSITKIPLYGFSSNSSTKYGYIVYNTDVDEAGIVVAGYTPTSTNDTVTIYSSSGGNVNSRIFSGNLRPIAFRYGFESYKVENNYGGYTEQKIRIFGISIDGSHIQIFDNNGTYLKTINVGTSGNAFVVGTVEVSRYGSGGTILIYSKENSHVRVVSTHEIHRVSDVQLTGNVLGVYSDGDTSFVVHKTASTNVAITCIGADGVVKFTKNFTTFNQNNKYGCYVSYRDGNNYLIAFNVSGSSFNYTKYNYSTGIIEDSYLISTNSGNIPFDESISNIKQFEILDFNRYLVYGKLSSGKSKFYGLDLDTCRIIYKETKNEDLSDYTDRHSDMLTYLNTSNGEITVAGDTNWTNNNVDV